MSKGVVLDYFPIPDMFKIQSWNSRAIFRIFVTENCLNNIARGAACNKGNMISKIHQSWIFWQENK